MSAASDDQTSTAVAHHNRHAASYHKCISCGKRFWQKNVLARRAAKCRGTRYNPDGSRWVCRAWRCRFNNQCPGADAACPICGAFKPPEFLPTQPVSASSPASLSRSASSVDPSLVPANQPPDRHCTGTSAGTPFGHPDSSSQGTTSVGANVETKDMNSRPLVTADEMISGQQGIVPSRGTITHLPCYEGVFQRFLTEV